MSAEAGIPQTIVDEGPDVGPLLMAFQVKRVLADIDADHGDSRIELAGHGVLLVFGAPCQLRLLAGREHDRTIPLPDLGQVEIPQRTGLLFGSDGRGAWQAYSEN